MPRERQAGRRRTWWLIRLSPPLTSHTTRTSTTAEFQGKVGFLGLGITGAPMASNLIRAG